MEFPEELRYTKEHEWTRVEGQRAVIGITDYAQHELGDVVYVELPNVGGRVTQFTPFGVVESVKAVSDLYAPVSGEVVEINSDLENHPDKINSDPYGAGWMIIVMLSDPSELEELLSAGEYAEYLKEAGE